MSERARCGKLGFCGAAAAALWLSAAPWSGPAIAAPLDIAVVTHKSVPSGEIDLARLTDIYTLNTRMWKDDSKLIVVDYAANPKIQKQFYEVLGVKAHDLRRLWLRRAFSGKAVLPKSFVTQTDLAQHVSTNPGTVGYVDEKHVTDDLQILLTIEVEK